MQQNLVKPDLSKPEKSENIGRIIETPREIHTIAKYIL